VRQQAVTKNKDYSMCRGALAVLNWSKIRRIWSRLLAKPPVNQYTKFKLASE